MRLRANGKVQHRCIGTDGASLEEEEEEKGEGRSKQADLLFKGGCASFILHLERLERRGIENRKGKRNRRWYWSTFASQ